MQALLQQLWNDETGAVLSAEAILILSILVVSCIIGLAQVTGALHQGIGMMYASFEATNKADYEDPFSDPDRYIDYADYSIEN